MGRYLVLEEDIRNYIDCQNSSLRELIESKICNIDLKILYQQKAIDKAEDNIRRELDKTARDIQIKFESSNEIRGAMQDQSATFVTRTEVKNIEEKTSQHISRSEHDALILQMDNKIEKLEAKIIGLNDKQLYLSAGIILTMIGAVLALVGTRI